MQLFPRATFQLVFFIFLIFGSWRLRALNAVVEAFGYRYDLQPIHSLAVRCPRTFRLGLRFGAWGQSKTS